MKTHKPILDLLVLTACCLLLAPAVSAETPQWHDVNEIRELAESRARQLAGNGDIRTEAGNLDQRLRLPRCGSPLESFVPPGTRVGQSITVGIRCTTAGGWSLYVPVRTVSYREVAVASRTLRRGATLAAADLRREKRDVTAVAGGWYDDPEQIVGQVLRRDLAAGQMLTPALLRRAVVITRGQQVTLLSRSGGIEIRARGKALADGASNERISVRNSSSGRIVEGIVRSADTVEVAG